eukprot:g32531.t1
MASSAVADSFQTREDAKKQKALQEARAAGTAAPETDEFTGKMINPHNPEFITKAPWYLNQDKPSLKHHQAWNAKSMGTRDWYIRGTKGDVKTKFIKGACENCGATTHTKKDCVERPRAVTAKQNGKNLMPDERLKAQKRLLKKKRKQRRRQLRRQAEGKEDDTDTGDSDTGDSDTDTDTDSDSEASDDEDLGEKLKDFDKSTSTVAAKDDKLRTTTRNLRIREDTAKYLLNLDVNSAFYDPKSRSMRQDPLAHLKDEEKGTTFRGDNFLRQSGDSKALTELMCFAWDSYKHGEKIHDTAQPTQALKMFEVYKNRATNLKEQQQKELLDKYGGEEHMEAPRELIFSQNENYVEYARDGRVLKGSERALTKSKYEEDVLIGNHSSTWGSWFDAATGRWGFACCHQCMKNSYCVPIQKAELEAGAEPEDEGVLLMFSVLSPSKLSEMRTSAFGHVLEEAEDLDEKKLADAVQQAKKKQILGRKEGRMTLDDAAWPFCFRHIILGPDHIACDRSLERNRPYNSLAGEALAGEISPEEYEAYRLTRQRADDPMAKFL